MAVFSHDAGGAQVLSGYLKENNINYDGRIIGPAKQVFHQKNLKVVEGNLITTINEADVVITSTSWQSRLELNAIRYSKDICKKSISILDHWVNYTERFKLDGKLMLPDEIWVCDNHALCLAKKNFPRMKIRKIKNYDIVDFQKKFMQKTNYYPPEESFLFLNDNTSEVRELLRNENDIKSQDEISFQNLLMAIKHKKIKDSLITIRLHPSEKLHCEPWYAKYLNDRIRISDQVNFSDDLHHHKFICGTDSMGMYYASKASKEVISCEKFHNVECSIPNKGILSLKEWCDL